MLAALQGADRVPDRIVSFWNDHDILLTPTLALPPVPIGWQEEGVTGALDSQNYLVIAASEK